MKRLVCEMCGGSDLVKQDGVFICQNCGTKYSVEEAKKMMVEGAVTVEGTVAVEGTVKVDKSEELKNLYILARRAKEADNSENACKYYNEIVLKDPDNWEANFYLVYYKAASCKKGQIGNEAYNVTNCLKSTIKLLVENLGTGDEAKGFIDGIRKDLAEIAGPMIHGAMDVHEYSYIGQILRMQEMLGNSLKEYPELHSQAVDAWKQLIATYIKYACFGEVKIDYVDMYGYTPEDAVRAIYELDPSYEDPFGITKKLRRNEKFITCPKCGATMRERESKCPQCGTPKEEIQRLIAEKEAAEAAERERIRKEREAKEAEEARIRAEKRAEWWAANKRKVGIAILILIGIIVSIVAVKKISDAIAAKHAVAEAYEMIEQGKELVSTYHFDEAKDLYDQAYRMTMDKEVRNTIQEQNDELAKARQAAESEYNNALRRLQILLDADDNEFNQYSNECLDKMIAIHPSARTTQYFQNMFANHPSLTSIQNYEQLGDELFQQAQYEKAVKKYEAAIVVFEMEDKTPSSQLIHKKETAQQCATLPKKATTEEKNQYSSAAKKKGGLIDLIIPDGTKEIKNKAYYERNDIKTVSIPNGVVRIGDHAFYDCESITSVTIPNSVTSIGYSAFCGCKNLTSIIIPNSVKFIDNYAFSGCKKITSIIIPNSVTSIGDMAFFQCTSLTSISIPNSVKSIGSEAFQDCKGLTSVTIPNSVTNIGNFAFGDCSSLTSISIPNGVKSIGNRAFGGCSGLTKVIMPNSVTSVGDNAFCNCTGLTSPVYNAHIFAYLPKSYSGAYSISEGIWHIAGYAFYKCCNLSSISIPNSVKSIGDEAFEGCSGLTSLTIPNSVKSIGSEAFQDCKGLTSVTIPNSVTNIGNFAFHNCTNLTLKIPKRFRGKVNVGSCKEIIYY